MSSKPKEIQVFDPLMLQPKAITLLPTATFQVRSLLMELEGRGTKYITQLCN